MIQSKKHRGSIPLCGLTVYELDDETSEIADIESSLNSKSKSKDKVNRILLITATGERVILEASTAEERNTWIGEIRVAVSSLEVNS